MTAISSVGVSMELPTEAKRSFELVITQTASDRHPPWHLLLALFGEILFLNWLLAKFLDSPNTTAAWGATAGFLAGFGWCFMGIGILDLCAHQRWLSHQGAHRNGPVLGAWR